MNRFVKAFCSFLFAPPKYKEEYEKNPSKILIIRQHNQLGDMLASSSLFRAIKNKYPLSHLTLIVSPANKDAVHKNKYIDRVVIFNKKHHANPLELTRFLSVLREKIRLGACARNCFDFIHEQPYVE